MNSDTVETRVRAILEPSTADEALRLRHAVRTLTRAGELEQLIHDGDGPLDRALQRYQRARPQLGKNDRAVLGGAVYRLARQRTLLLECGRDWVAGEGNYLLLALMDACGGGELGRVPHLPGGVRPWRRLLAHLDRRRGQILQRVLPHLEDDPRQVDSALQGELAALLSVPPWWLAAGPWSTLAAALTELAALRLPQQLILRVQRHRGVARDEVLASLRTLEVPARATERSEWGVVVEGRHNVLATELYRSGVVEVQDEGSQLIADLCDPKPKERVLDLCAGGGGKALALASAMGGRGEVFAYDVDQRRLRDVARRARRAQLGNIRVLGSADEVADNAPYDVVLADVPCSSSGTLRRNPDVAWRWEPSALAQLQRVQAEIFERAADLVRVDGCLVYATCSLLEGENEEQVANFLAQRSDFEPAPPGDRRGHRVFADVAQAGRGYFRLPADLPHYAGDGFFAARLQRLR